LIYYTKVHRAFLRTLNRPHPDEMAPDQMARLALALAPRWQIERATDYLGAVSVVAVPFDDDPAEPTFMLYEADGNSHVATIMQDAWECDDAFETCGHAVTALIARTTAR
jgi:hypothetical protein